MKHQVLLHQKKPLKPTLMLNSILYMHQNIQTATSVSTHLSA